MSQPEPHFEIVGELSDDAIDALADLLINLIQGTEYDHDESSRLSGLATTQGNAGSH